MNGCGVGEDGWMDACGRWMVVGVGDDGWMDGWMWGDE